MSTSFATYLYSSTRGSIRTYAPHSYPDRTDPISSQSQTRGGLPWPPPLPRCPVPREPLRQHEQHRGLSFFTCPSEMGISPWHCPVFLFTRSQDLVFPPNILHVKQGVFNRIIFYWPLLYSIVGIGPRMKCKAFVVHRGLLLPALTPTQTMRQPPALRPALPPRHWTEALAQNRGRRLTSWEMNSNFKCNKRQLWRTLPHLIFWKESQLRRPPCLVSPFNRTPRFRQVRGGFHVTAPSLVAAPFFS